MKPFIIIIAILAIVALIFSSQTALALEKPKYTLVSKSGSLEIREYKPVMLASTSLQGPYKDSTRSGFRTIAGYIFGDNTAQEKIAMTAPVLVENPQNPEYTMAFVMPSDSVAKGLPAPNTQRLQLQEQSWGSVAVWSFGGWATEKRLEKEWSKMQVALQKQNIVVEEYDWIAQYNPPSMPPPFRHNEIWVLLP